jgi:hypothetical protein
MLYEFELKHVLLYNNVTTLKRMSLLCGLGMSFLNHSCSLVGRWNLEHFQVLTLSFSLCEMAHQPLGKKRAQWPFLH